MGLRVVWDFALYGTSRCMGLRVVWDFALYGTSRCMGLRAVRDFAPFGTSRRSELRVFSRALPTPEDQTAAQLEAAYLFRRLTRARLGREDLRPISDLG